MPLDLVSDEVVAGAQHFACALVTEAIRQLCRADDVREEDGDGAFRQLLYQLALLPVAALSYMRAADDLYRRAMETARPSATGLWTCTLGRAGPLYELRVLSAHTNALCG